MTHEHDELSVTTKLLYGVGDIGNAMVNSAVLFFLMIFYTDAALIPPAVAGLALSVGRVWDAINDPLFGWISDRTTSRFGKRRVYMIFGALPLAIAVALLWFVPQGLSAKAQPGLSAKAQPGLSNSGAFLWIVGTFIVFDTMVTLTGVPYYALTAELTEDYDERASLTTFRMVMGVPAYIVGAAVTPALVGLFAVNRVGYSVVGLLYGIVAAVALWVSAAGLRERPAISESKSEIPPLRAFLATLRNRPFVRLIIAYLVANAGFALVQTLLAYFLTYQLDMADQVPIVMFVLLGTVGLCLFPWKVISSRWNKGPAYALGLLIGGLAAASTFLLPQGPTPWIYAIACVAGIGFATNWVFPWAMVPDVVEYDRLETNEHRGGMYYGVWGFAQKLTNVLGIALSGWVLDFFGYVPNVAQTERALFGIRLFMGPVPLLIFAVALPLLFWYPITRASHAEVVQKLAARGRGQAEPIQV